MKNREGLGGCLLKVREVSVPLRGNGYEKQLICLIADSFMSTRQVSVPLRGNGYEKLWIGCVLWQRYSPFPSPCGEMGMKNDSLSKKDSSGAREFPSPCGEMGMKNIFVMLNPPAPAQRVSVPLRGNGYEKHDHRRPRRAERRQVCFRPLAGKWV